MAIWTLRVTTGQLSSARTALGLSHPQRLICSRRIAYIPVMVQKTVGKLA